MKKEVCENENRRDLKGENDGRYRGGSGAMGRHAGTCCGMVQKAGDRSNAGRQKTSVAYTGWHQTSV